MPETQDIYRGTANINKAEGSHDVCAGKAKTFCHLLWERAFINEYGYVFFCCLCKPEPIGNIYQHDLAYIWKDKKAQFFRQMSLKGELSCYAGCTVLSKKEKEIGLGRFYRSQGRLTEAETAFRDALEMNSASPDLYFESGWLYIDLGKFKEAEAAFKKFLELEPKNANAYVGLGWLCKKEKKYTEAKVLFKKALKLNPESFAAYAELGWLYKDLGRLKDAEAFFKKALELNPNTESALVGLGRFYQDQDKLGAARSLLGKALELNPRNEVAFGFFTEVKNKEEEKVVEAGQSVNEELSPDKNPVIVPQNNESDLGINEKTDLDYPRTFHILIGSFCPLNCVMCPQDHLLNVALNNVILKKSIDWSRVDDIVFQGGEVLAIPSAREFLIWLTEKLNKKIKLVTNGLLVDRVWAERLIRGAEWLEVSVNASTKKIHEVVNRGSNFERVIRNIKMLIAYKHKLGAKTNIRYHFTIIPENIHETAKAIKFADQLGCDLIAYSFDSPRVENFLSTHKEIKEKIRDEILGLMKNNLKIKIQRNQLEQLGLIENIDPDFAIDEY